MDFKCFVPDCGLEPQFDWVFDAQHTYSCKNHQIHDISTFISRKELSGVEKLILKHKNHTNNTSKHFYLLMLLLVLPVLYFYMQNIHLNLILRSEERRVG